MTGTQALDAWGGAWRESAWEARADITLGALQVLCMDQYRLSHLEEEQLLLVVTSTFGQRRLPGKRRGGWPRARAQGSGGW